MKKNIRRRKSPTFLQNIIEAALIAHNERRPWWKERIPLAELPPIRLRPIPGISDPADIEEYDRLEAEEKKEWEEVRKDWEENMVKA
jgi:hypothetical protein